MTSKNHNPVKALREEKEAWDIRAKTLSVFIGTNPAFDTLSPEEQDRLREKCEVMWQYSEILGQQINAAGE